MDYRALWEQHTDIIYDQVNTTQVREKGAAYSRTKTAIGIGLIGISMIDGPAPIMDAIAVIGWELLLGD